MKNHKLVLRSLFVPGLLFIGACCGGKTVVEAPKPLPPPPPVTSQLGDIFFDFDRSDLRTDAREQLQTNYHWLEEHPSRKVNIEGNCDERGTSEYNMALGESRANSARDFLMLCFLIDLIPSAMGRKNRLLQVTTKRHGLRTEEITLWLNRAV